MSARHDGVQFDCHTRLDNHTGVLGAHAKKEWRTFIEYDLILLDLRLQREDPRSNLPIDLMSGFRLLKEEIRHRDPTAPVIMFTASERVEYIEALQAQGIAGYFVKPHSRFDDPATDDDFQRLKSAIIRALQRCEIRDFWRRSVELNKRIRAMKELGERVSREDREAHAAQMADLEQLLNAAYFQIHEAHPEVSRKRYYHNVAILLYYQCLEVLAASFKIDPKEKDFNVSAGGLAFILSLADKAGPNRGQVLTAAKRLNGLRNEYVHAQSFETSARVPAGQPPRRRMKKASEKHALEAFGLIETIIGAFAPRAWATADR